MRCCTCCRTRCLTDTVTTTRHDHADGHEGHSHSVQDLAVWLWTIAGMMTFLMLEKFVRAQTGGGHSHGHSHIHGHGHSHGSDSPSETERTRVEKSSNQRNDANLRKRTSTKSKSEEKEDAAAPVADDKRDESTNAHKQIAARGIPQSRRRLHAQLHRRTRDWGDVSPRQRLADHAGDAAA
ncbi:hypothetical protein PINS_up020201 [Pythium insidiosum]|nr:hypothetical protein PINS_up020201 [Pythium insidiosum]